MLLSGGCSSLQAEKTGGRMRSDLNGLKTLPSVDCPGGLDSEGLLNMDGLSRSEQEARKYLFEVRSRLSELS